LELNDGVLLGCEVLEWEFVVLGEPLKMVPNEVVLLISEVEEVRLDCVVDCGNGMCVELDGLEGLEITGPGANISSLVLSVYQPKCGT
jgi:hypothetical protein